MPDWAQSFFEYSWPELIILLRVVVAAGCGAVVGFEREISGKAAGLRTHVVVSIASALFAGVSLLLVEIPRVAAFDSDGNALEVQSLDSDLVRAVQSVATGIGFLGAGVIFVQRRRHHRSHVRGLTTAASIWAISAIGLTVGFGYYVLSIGTTILVWFSLWIADTGSLDDIPDDEDYPDVAPESNDSTSQTSYSHRHRLDNKEND